MFGRKRLTRRGEPQIAEPVKPEDALVSALQQYRDSVRTALAGQPDGEARTAAKTLAAANRIIEEGGLGMALASTLLKHVEHWPAWVVRPDFDRYVGIPVSEVRAGKENGVSHVDFAYKGRKFGINSSRKLVSRFIEDDYDWGDISLYIDEIPVLCGDIKRDITKDHARWRWSQVSCFVAGDWMPLLLELAAILEASEAKRVWEPLHEDQKRRARNIVLPTGDVDG